MTNPPPDYFESEKKLIELARSILRNDDDIYSVSFKVVRTDGDWMSHQSSRRVQDDPANEGDEP